MKKSKYQPIATYLTSLTCNEIELTFLEIESILQTTLPTSAKRHEAWWANSMTKDSHTWAHLWISAGWKVQKRKIEEQKVVFQRATEYEFFDIDSEKAREGYDLDSKILKYGRNTNLAQMRKKIDNYQCQACLFRLAINGKWVIEVHHLNPLNSTGETINSVNELVSLCPTCHRIAHTRDIPYEIDQIRELRKQV